MRAERNTHHIASLKDWEEFAGPKSADQWVEGRSAYELANAWCGRGHLEMPSELRGLLDSHSATRGLSVEVVNPEHRISFDKLGGEPRNADLAFVGASASGTAAVTVEAKADETFGGTVSETLSAGLERLLENPRSQGVQRVVGLVRALFLQRTKGQAKVSSLRYQLLTAAAGTLAYAVDQKADAAVLVVHEFVTSKTQDRRHAKNAADYGLFLARLAGNATSLTDEARLQGPFLVPGAPLFENVPPLFVGKITTHRRGMGA